MRAVTVTLKRVFDVIQVGGARFGSTLFSAELEDGARLLSVSIAGRPNVGAGSVLTLFLNDPRELRGVIAVRDEATGRVYRENTLTRIIWPCIEVLGACVMLVLLLASLLPWSAALVLLGVGYVFWLVSQDLRVSAALKAAY